MHCIQVIDQISKNKKKCHSYNHRLSNRFLSNVYYVRFIIQLLITIDWCFRLNIAVEQTLFARKYQIQTPFY